MQKKLLTKIFAAIFCVNFACTHVEEKNPFIISDLPHIQAFEKQDHSFCSSLKINFDKSIDLDSSLYWRCRLSLAKYRLRTDGSPESAKQNTEISNLVTKISLKLASTPESILFEENAKMNERQHKKCLALGYQINTEDLAKIDDYFSCRKALIADQQLVPPFGNTDYLEYPNHSYNIGFVVDRRVDKEIQRYNLAKENYPTCVKFNLDSLNFKNCTLAQDRSRQCFSEIDKKKFLKEMDEKIICQRWAYIRFPNSLLKGVDQKQIDLERTKTNSDYNNQLNFAALGIDDKDFVAAPADEGEEVDNADEAKIKKAKRRAAEKKINSNQKLYDKFELTRLRQKYIFSCQKEADLRVASYIKDLKESCHDAEKFALIGE